MQYLILIFIMIIGGLSSLGECIFLGFLKDFHSKNVASWGVGTGLAALAGSLLIYLENTTKKLYNYGEKNDSYYF